MQNHVVKHLTCFFFLHCVEIGCTIQSVLGQINTLVGLGIRLAWRSQSVLSSIVTTFLWVYKYNYWKQTVVETIGSFSLASVLHFYIVSHQVRHCGKCSSTANEFLSEFLSATDGWRSKRPDGGKKLQYVCHLQKSHRENVWWKHHLSEMQDSLKEQQLCQCRSRLTMRPWYLSLTLIRRTEYRTSSSANMFTSLLCSAKSGAVVVIWDWTFFNN